MIARKLLLGAWLLVAASGCEDAEDPAVLSEDGDPATEEHTPTPSPDANVPEDAGPEAPGPEVTKVRVSPTSGLSTSEGGRTASFTVELTAKPTAEVSIRLFSTAEQEGVPDRSELVFTPDAWQEQTVTVIGQNDAQLDGSVLYQIVLDETVSDDLRYQSVPVSDVTILNIDDASSGDVVISVTSSDPSEGLPERDTVTINSMRFPTTVKVCGVDDSEDDGDVPYTVTLAVQSSDDPAFQRAAPVVLSLTNLDHD